jgi:hypothetical protein
MAIIACINCYNDWPLIKGCVESIYDQADRIIAVDGKYKDFPNDKWYSTDGTIEYLSSLEKVELVFAADLYEADKRNVYMDMLESGDTVLILDGDEYVEGSIKKLDKGIDIGLVKLGEPEGKYKRLATRFFKYRKGLRHNGIHFILEYNYRWFNNRCNAVNGFKEKKVNTFEIIHLARKRSRTRKFQKEQYKKAARKREQQFKTMAYE